MPDLTPPINGWPALLDRATLASYLSVGTTTIDQLAASGRLGPRAIELSKRCPRWSRVEVDRWIADGMPPRAQWINQSRGRVA